MNFGYPKKKAILVTCCVLGLFMAILTLSWIFATRTEISEHDQRVIDNLISSNSSIVTGALYGHQWEHLTSDHAQTVFRKKVEPLLQSNDPKILRAAIIISESRPSGIGIADDLRGRAEVDQAIKRYHEISGDDASSERLQLADEDGRVVILITKKTF